MSQYTVSLTELPDSKVLESAWCELEVRASNSFFVSWAWIGRWLAHLPPQLPKSLLRVEIEGRAVGLAIVCRRVQLRRSLLGRSRSLYFNCTGDPELDELTIEYNALLVESGREDNVLRAVISHLSLLPDWDELQFDGWDHSKALHGAVLPEFGLRVIERTSLPCYRVDLRALRQANRAYIDSLPRKIRYNLRRALRGAEDLGTMTMDVAANSLEASQFLEGLKELHQRSWSIRGKPGSFANQFFSAFHADMVSQSFDQNIVQLVRMRVGTTPVGYIYNFVFRGRVYNYQSGFDLNMSSGAAWRPGVVCHAQAIELSLAAGLDVYDFMAGDYVYKKELGSDPTEMSWLTVQRPRLKFRIEAYLKTLLSAWRAAFAAKRLPAAPAGD